MCSDALPGSTLCKFFNLCQFGISNVTDEYLSGSVISLLSTLSPHCSIPT